MRYVTMLAATLMAAGCGWWGDGESVVGFVVSIEAPDTAIVGEPFAIQIRTAGANGCWRRHRTDVSVDGLEATVVPRDEKPGRGQTCSQAPVEILHEATVTFAMVGQARIAVTGREGAESVAVVVE